MRFRAGLSVGAGLAAAVTLSAPTSPAFADTRNGNPGPGGDAAALAQQYMDPQQWWGGSGPVDQSLDVIQIALGQVGVAQNNINEGINFESPGSNGGASQLNTAAGSAVNADSGAQTGKQGPDSLGGALSSSPDQTQPVFQLAIGQLGVVQTNINVPINVFSPGVTENTNQANVAAGSAVNWATGSQVGTQVGSVGGGGSFAASLPGVQLAIGQFGVVQTNINVPIHVLDGGIAAALPKNLPRDIGAASPAAPPQTTGSK